MLSAMNASGKERLSRLGVHVPEILLPRPGVDLYRWAVIACDQHTSEPDYWEEVESIVGDRPSTLHTIYPEVYLGEARPEERIGEIHRTMQRYLNEDIVQSIGEAMILTIRGTPHVSERRGLMLALDLDQYEYAAGAQSLTRATEQTIVERIPPRVRIRAGAPLELPHVMVLIDDADDVLFGGLLGRNLERLYATQLMLGGGQVAGYRVDDDALEHITATLERLLEQSAATEPFLFAVGDGNHSLATAKTVWDGMKSDAPSDHPARYALVEVVNLYDPGLRFEPIHRLVRCEDPSGWVGALAQDIGDDVRECSIAELESELQQSSAAIGYVTSSGSGLITLSGSRELPVATVQSYINRRNDVEVDYIHGWDTSVQLGRRPNSAVIILPDFNQRLLYPTVAKRGVLPRKAFSLGDAEEKRYYLEARRIS
jgi:hypothetical protein